MNNYHRGKFAELLAAFYMLCHGYRIVGRNYVTGRGTTAGEIDLICRKRHTLVFMEIKQRQTTEKAAYAISRTQQQRIIRGAQSFVKSHPQYKNDDIRFDAVLIVIPFNICHIKNAWIVD